MIMVEVLQTPRHISVGGAHELPTVLCPRCRRAMSVKRIKKDINISSFFGRKTATKFFLKYTCKDCETEWEEEEKPIGTTNKDLITLIAILGILFGTFYFILKLFGKI